MAERAPGAMLNPVIRQHHTSDLIALFDQLFAESENTRLIKGDDEPVYIPASEQQPYHQLVFAHGFYASALHEIAHWCIAGQQRRQLLDYGYWYAPDGRNPQQQAEFETVEIKPQALEWIFCKLSQRRFRISVDNLNGPQTDTSVFKRAVYQQVKQYCQHRLPARAQLLAVGLADFYGTSFPLDADQFSMSEID